jgi:hypothetical protein
MPAVVPRREQRGTQLVHWPAAAFEKFFQRSGVRSYCPSMSSLDQPTVLADQARFTTGPK